MSHPIESAALCGACGGVSSVTPVMVQNRPGLPAIQYRIGTHAGFLGSMLARLSAEGPEGLATREKDDFSIALLDAWAVVGDVLTFYQERIANEHYWRTAKERRSLLELARLLGYELSPGIAAETKLAFTVERLPSAPETITLPAGIRVQSVPGLGETPQTFETVEPLVARPEWNLLRPRRKEIPIPSGDEILLDGTGLGIRADDGLLILVDRKWAFRRVRRFTIDAGLTKVVLDAPLSLADAPAGVTLPSGPEVHLFRLQTTLFGYNAPDWKVMPEPVHSLYLKQFDDKDWPEWPGLSLECIETQKGSKGVPPVALHIAAADAPISILSWIVLARTIDSPKLMQVNKVAASHRALFALTSKTTRIEVSPSSDLGDFDRAVRETTVYAQPEMLTLAKQELTTPLFGRSITLDQKLVARPDAGRTLLIRGVSADTGKMVGESVVLHAVQKDAMTLELEADLQEHYRPATVSIFANVAAATHGETVTEILGSGDAGRTFQAFRLSQAPVTHIVGESGGAASTLEVWVGGVRWREVASLYDAGPRDRVYVVRRDDAEHASVGFGDGIHGSRLPSGVENVLAVYRKGLGRAGLVRADQLSLLVSRPLGLKSASNPLAAAHAEDPQTLGSARRTGPLAVLTLGRVVSLSDYRDFAVAFPSIAKADATWVWDGHNRAVALTVAGTDGAGVLPGEGLATKLLAALNAARDRLYQVHLYNYRSVPFRIAGRVLAADDRDPAEVLAAVRRALTARFTFDSRELGQAVTLGEVAAVMQSVAGVVAINVTGLYRSGDPCVPHGVLTAARPEAGIDFAAVLGTELLVLDPPCLTDVMAGL